MVENAFGDDWTREKLECLQRYLAAYRLIFDTNERARHLQTIYVDAFAGSGTITIGRRSAEVDQEESLLPEFSRDRKALIDGSTRIALEFEPGFDRYVFIEKHGRRARSLEQLRTDFPYHADKIEVHKGNSNVRLQKLCVDTDWRRNRAVVFLDPYGMQVDWETVKMLGQTKAVDLWYLFSIMGVNRMLTRSRKPPRAWVDRITRCIGDGWEDEFYSTPSTLFDELDRPSIKQADTKRIGRFIVRRLEQVFTGVARQPRLICTRGNSPLFLLCFACGDETGCGPALKIAQHILKMKTERSHVN
ncbi:MAG: three-Cys-motif partner protein TcmP [Fimbriimonadales bacterium]